MSFFNFLNKKKSNAAADMQPVINLAETVADTGGSDSSSNSELNSLTVSYATGWPIDVIYGYLHKNYEEKGFKDAMTKCELAFRDMNMNIIKNKILMVFREINLNYDVMKREVKTRMNTCSAAGLISCISDLENQMSIIEAHKQELEELEREFKANVNESVPLQSYNCGFLRGIASITMSNPQKQTTIPMGQMTRSFTRESVSA